MTDPAEPTEPMETESGAVTAKPAEPTRSEMLDPGEPAAVGAKQPADLTESEILEPAEPAAVADAPAAHVPSVPETISDAIAALVRSGSDLRLLSVVAVLFGVVFVAIPLASAFAFAIAAPLYLAFGPADDAIVLWLGLAAFASFFVGFIAFFVFTIQFPLMVTAMVGGRLAGLPLTLREALRRARQVFWRSLGASILSGLLSSVPATVVGLAASVVLGRTELATGINIAASIVLASPWVYVLPGIVLGGVGAVEALRRSWRLARFKWRLAVTIATLGVVGGQIVVAAASTVLGALATAVSLAPASAQIAESPPPPVIGILVLIGAIVLISVYFATQAVKVAPETSGFFALTAYASALDQARGGKPEPLFRRPARVLYAVGLAGTALVVAGVLSTWPPAERGPWERQTAGGITFEIPSGWNKQFEDTAGASFAGAGSRVSVWFDAAGATTEDLVLRHLALLAAGEITEEASEELTIDGRAVREVVATALVTQGRVDVPFTMVIEIGPIGGHDRAFIVNVPSSAGAVQDFYTGEAKRFARHVWTSGMPTS
jgi:hypothetical protein